MGRHTLRERQEKIKELKEAYKLFKEMVYNKDQYGNGFEYSIPLEIKLFPVDLTKTVRIIRQPIHNADAVFHQWDSAYSGDTTRSYDSDGNAILLSDLLILNDLDDLTKDCTSDILFDGALIFLNN